MYQACNTYIFVDMPEPDLSLKFGCKSLDAKLTFLPNLKLEFAQRHDKLAIISFNKECCLKKSDFRRK